MKMDKPLLVGGVKYPNVIREDTSLSQALHVRGDLLTEFIARVASAYPDYTFKAVGNSHLTSEGAWYAEFHVSAEGLVSRDEHIMTVEQVYRNHGPCLHLYAPTWKKHTKSVKIAVKTFASRGVNKSSENVMLATISVLQSSVASIRREKEWAFNSTQTALMTDLRDTLRNDPMGRAEVFAMSLVGKEDATKYEAELAALATAITNFRNCSSIGTFVQVTPTGKCLVTYASRGDSVDTYESTYELPEAVRASLGILKMSPRQKYIEEHGISSDENQYYIPHEGHV